MPVPRSVLANLENGRREDISVAELLVVAYALKIAPIQLIVSLGQADKVEIFPRQEIEPWAAWRWFVGFARLSNGPDGLELDQNGDDEIVPLFAHHSELEDQWFDIGPREWILDSDGHLIETTAELKSGVAKRLRELRSRMRSLGLTPPILPPELVHVDRERVRPSPTRQGQATAAPGQQRTRRADEGRK